MDEEESAHLLAGARLLGVPLSTLQIQQLGLYVERLLKWNQKLNLTAITEPRAIVDKHLLDSLALVPFVRDSATVLDVGTGAGLPAIVLAIACPTLQITAIDSIHKKITFVRSISRELSLALQAQPVRLERLDPAALFDRVVSRATFEPSEWITRGAERVAPAGRLLAMLSAQQGRPAAPGGFVAEPGAEHVLGGAVRRIVCFRRESG